MIISFGSSKDGGEYCGGKSQVVHIHIIKRRIVSIKSTVVRKALEVIKEEKKTNKIYRNVAACGAKGPRQAK